MIGIVDYGAGNLRSVANALDRIGVGFVVCHASEDLKVVDKVVLPGVGHFAAAAGHLAQTGLLSALRDWGRERRPMLGICLGMQLLFEESEEAPSIPGLGLLSGRVVRLQARRVPHMGWNTVAVTGGCQTASEGVVDHYYFAHSYVVTPSDPSVVSGWAKIDGVGFPAIVEEGRLSGVQFHPEKSGEAGLRLLTKFAQC
jgi:glutamine amidotransferase